MSEKYFIDGYTGCWRTPCHALPYDTRATDNDCRLNKCGFEVADDVWMRTGWVSTCWLPPAEHFQMIARSTNEIVLSMHELLWKGEGKMDAVVCEDLRSGPIWVCGWCSGQFLVLSFLETCWAKCMWAVTNQRWCWYFYFFMSQNLSFMRWKWVDMFRVSLLI